MGPDALRVAGIAEAFSSLGFEVKDTGQIAPDTVLIADRANVFRLAENIGWTQAIQRATRAAATDSLPVILGGDHAVSMGSVLGMSDHAAQTGRPLFVLWLDAHSDFHTPETTQSGNLHGTPVAYITGQAGFDGFPEVASPVPLDQLMYLGLRSVDMAERRALDRSPATVVDMRGIDEHGIKRPLEAFLGKVAAANGLLHVSLDTDFLDPSLAPAVGTTVPGGATLRESHLVMELLHDSGLVSALDIVELNPALDERGRTAEVLVDLAASLMGRRIFDRPTLRFG